MELLLLIISSILKWSLSPLLWIVGVICSYKQKEHKKYFKDLAISKDQYGNTVGKYVFNYCLIKSNGYKFGNIDETISSVLGKNKTTNTLSKIGKLLDYILDLLDPNHSIKSIDHNIYNKSK